MTLPTLNGFTKKVSDLLDRPNTQMTSAELKAWFDSAPEELRVFLNSSLSKIDTDFALKSEINGVVLGQILDGSLTDIKLSNATDQVKARLAKVITDLANFIATKGAASGLATLDSTSKVPIANLPSQIASGVFADTVTSIPANGTYTKTIPIGISGATHGSLLVIGQNAIGAIVYFTTASSEAIALSNAPTNYIWGFSKSRDGYLTTNSFGVSEIQIYDCYLSGTNLVIVFKNTNVTNANIINVNNCVWEVSK